MNPWDIVSSIFRGVMLDFDAINNIPVLLINRILSFDKEFLKYNCDGLNKFYPLTDKQWYQLFLVCFKGKSRRIDYIKKEKTKISPVIERFQTSIKQYYKWSDRELVLNSSLLFKDEDFLKLIPWLGFTKSEQEKIFEYIKE